MPSQRIAGAAACVAVMLAASGCGGDGRSGNEGLAPDAKQESPSASAAPSPSATTPPLSVDAAVGALLDVDDMPVGWTSGEEHLDGTYLVKKENLRGMKGGSASCDDFITRTNDAMGLPVVAVERVLEKTGGGSVTVRVVSYRDAVAAAMAIDQLRKAPAECPHGGTKDGLQIDFKRSSAPRVGDESVGTQMLLMGVGFGDVQVRVGSSVVQLTFTDSPDAAEVSEVTGKAADRLQAVVGA